MQHDLNETYHQQQSREPIPQKHVHTSIKRTAKKRHFMRKKSLFLFQKKLAMLITDV